MITKKNEGVFVIIAIVVAIGCLFFIFGLGRKKPQSDEVVSQKVTFIDSYDNSVVKKIEVLKGKGVTPPKNPEHENMTFIGWYLESDREKLIKDFSNIIEDTTVIALYNKTSEKDEDKVKDDLNKDDKEDKTETKTHTVSFLDSITGKIYKTQKVKNSKDVKIAKAPIHAGYIFKEFVGNTKNITNDEQVTAIYEKSDKTYSIKYKTVIKNVEGKNPSYKKEFLVNEKYKILKPNYTLKNAKFVGWTKDSKKAQNIITDEKELAKIKLIKPNSTYYATENVTYYAVFVSIKNETGVDNDNVNNNGKDDVNQDANNNGSTVDKPENNIDNKFTVKLKYIIEYSPTTKKEVVKEHSILGNNLFTINPEEDLKSTGIDYSYFQYDKKSFTVVNNVSKIIPLYYRGKPTITKISKEAKDEKVLITITAEDILNNSVSAYSFDGGKTWQSENYFEADFNEELEVLVKDKFGFISDVKNVFANNFVEQITPEYNILIDYQNGTKTTKSMFLNSSIKLTVPKKSGYVFGGWQTSSGKIVDNVYTLVEKSDVKITALWKRREELSFDNKIQEAKTIMEEPVQIISDTVLKNEKTSDTNSTGKKSIIIKQNNKKENAVIEEEKVGSITFEKANEENLTLKTEKIFVSEKLFEQIEEPNYKLKIAEEKVRETILENLASKITLKLDSNPTQVGDKISLTSRNKNFSRDYITIKNQKIFINT